MSAQKLPKWQINDELPTHAEALAYLESEGLNVEKIKEDGRRMINKIRVMLTDRDGLAITSEDQ